MSCAQLAQAGLFLACGGRNPVTGHSVVSAARARRINALMMLCGHYDGSGEFAYRVGLRARVASAAEFCALRQARPPSPLVAGAQHLGNSLLGARALERLAREDRWSVFG